MTIRVLIIDDEEGIRAMAMYSLNARGYAVTVAANGLEGVEKSRNQKFDVAITDLTMPSIDGIEVLVELKKVDAAVAVIMASGFAPPDSIRRAREKGAFGFISKPFQIDELCALINKAALKEK